MNTQNLLYQPTGKGLGKASKVHNEGLFGQWKERHLLNIWGAP
jgi:hypothetical protein